MHSQTIEDCEYQKVIADISDLNWPDLTEAEVVQVAWAYYFFSIQFRENLNLAREIFSEDEDLIRLEHRQFVPLARCRG
jgi:hypothetical protein